MTSAQHMLWMLDEFELIHGGKFPGFITGKPVGMGGSLDVSVTVRNTGGRAGSEVVQLYVRDLVGSVTRPVKELKGFRKVRLGAGWSQEVTFTLTADDLAFYTARGTWEAEPGEFEVGVGPNSRDLGTARFTLK